MGNQIDAKNYWENKIVGWEDGRYMKTENSGGIENLADKASNSLRFRLIAATQLLTPHVVGKNIVEIGCGSALLAEKLLDLGAASYQGYDFAEAAVTRANERLAAAGLSDKARLDVVEVANLKPLNADVIFSLGLFDWLTLDDIEHIFTCSEGAVFLHAIAEKRVSLQQIIHQIYVQVAYGYCPSSYKMEQMSA